MLFSSLEFLFLFLPVTLILYFALPKRGRNTVLLISSLVFYAWGGPPFLILMVLTVLMDYGFGRLIYRFRDAARAKKRILVLAIVANLLLLAFFKYTDFLIESLARIPAFSDLKPLGITLPIGISFYTFQALSYVIDVYRGDAEVQRNPFRFGLYVSLFPQLIAGPIVRYKDVDAELSDRSHTLSNAANGFITFTVGLAKKVLLANSFGELWQNAYRMPGNEQSVLMAWFGIAAFALQIYFDFSGYSDMAIGLGRMFGFHFLENFAYPYTARSITEFWRRWHISLSTWFREYVYIPLGGNRKGSARTYLNLLVVWALTGIWHGASWNFLLWGLYYFLLLVLEKAFFGKLLDRLPRAVGHIYAIFMILIGWLIFAFDGSDTALLFSDGVAYFLRMFGVGSAGFVSGVDLYEILRNGILIVIAVIACLPMPRRLYYRLYGRHSGGMQIFSLVAVLFLLVLSTAYLVDSSYNPFLYFRF